MDFSYESLGIILPRDFLFERSQGMELFALNYPQMHSYPFLPEGVQP